MSFGTNDEHVSYQMRNVHDQVARARSPRRVSGNGHPRSQGYLPRLRSLVGFTLVEAGLHLLPEGSRQRG
jgi:hypothetical protein